MPHFLKPRTTAVLNFTESPHPASSGGSIQNQMITFIEEEAAALWAFINGGGVRALMRGREQQPGFAELQAPILNEAALEKAYEVGEIVDEEEKQRIRWAILVYETEKQRRDDRH